MSELLTREELEALLACFSVENEGLSTEIVKTTEGAELDYISHPSENVLNKITTIKNQDKP